MNGIVIIRRGELLELINGSRRLEAMLAAFGEATVSLDGVEATVKRNSAGLLVVVESASGPAKQLH